MLRYALLLAAGVIASPSLAEPPQIRDATATRSGTTWRVSVTLAHPDTGWDHYADGWEVLHPDGTRLGLRELHHPHVDEQPFTRSLSGVEIPDGTERVRVRARCSVDGWGEETVSVDLSR
jgi:hypothetical protein